MQKYVLQQSRHKTVWKNVKIGHPPENPEDAACMFHNIQKNKLFFLLVLAIQYILQVVIDIINIQFKSAYRAFVSTADHIKVH